MANEERMYSESQVRDALKKWVEENQKSKTPLLDRIIENAAMYHPVDLARQTQAMGQGFMNMPGYMAPVSTGELNKIPSAMKGWSTIGQIIAQIAKMYFTGGAAGALGNAGAGGSAASAASRAIGSGGGGGMSGLMDMFGGGK